MLSLIFCFTAWWSTSPPSLIWLNSEPFSDSTVSITCLPCPEIWLLLFEEVVDVGDDVDPTWRSGKLLLACNLMIFCVNIFSFTSIFVAKSQSVLVEVDTILPVFSSTFTWELTFFIAPVLLLVEGASVSALSGSGKENWKVRKSSRHSGKLWAFRKAFENLLRKLWAFSFFELLEQNLNFQKSFVLSKKALSFQQKLQAFKFYEN